MLCSGIAALDPKGTAQHYPREQLSEHRDEALRLHATHGLLTETLLGHTESRRVEPGGIGEPRTLHQTHV